MGEKSEKAVYVGANVVLAIVWARFLFQLTTRWHAMDTNLRGPVGLFMMFFSLLWLSMLIGGKRRFAPAPLLMAGGVLLTVIEIVRKLM